MFVLQWDDDRSAAMRGEAVGQSSLDVRKLEMLVERYASSAVRSAFSRLIVADKEWAISFAIAAQQAGVKLPIKIDPGGACWADPKDQAKLASLLTRQLIQLIRQEQGLDSRVRIGETSAHAMLQQHHPSMAAEQDMGFELTRLGVAGSQQQVRERDTAPSKVNPVSDQISGVVPGHAFISYVREDAERVDRLQAALESAGIKVWRDTDNLWPGRDWKIEISQAIKANSLAFIACFSKRGVSRERSYQYEELNLAVEEMRLRRPGESWLIPVRFDDCELPHYEIGPGRTLGSLQWLDLFDDSWERGANRLVKAVLNIFS